MQAYCVRCRAKQDMLSPTRTLTKNARRAMIGQCACCGTTVSVIGVWDKDPAPIPSANGATSHSETRAADAPDLPRPV